LKDVESEAYEHWMLVKSKQELKEYLTKKLNRELSSSHQKSSKIRSSSFEIFINDYLHTENTDSNNPNSLPEHQVLDIKENF
jgi:anti-sigma regulatory factor (Ser/Thr protein kinase)